MNRPAPVPLFNYKKRQRQALVSDPDLANPFEDRQHFQQNRDSSNGSSSYNHPTSKITKKSNTPTASIPKHGTGDSHKVPSKNLTPGLMDMSGKFSSGGNRSSSLSSVTQGNPNNAGKNSIQSSPFRGQQTGSPFNNTNRGRGLGNASMSPHPANQNNISQGKGQLKLNNFSSPLPRGGHAATVRRGSFSTSNVPNGRRGAHQSQQWGGNSASSSRQQPYNEVSSGKQASFTSSSASKMPNRSSTMSSAAAGASMMHTRNETPSSNCKPSNFSRRPAQLAPKGNFNTANTSYTECNFDFEEKSIFDVRQKIPTQTKPKRGSEKPVQDTSMRIFTCPISSLKSWVGLKVNSGPVMFEVYGLLDSATVKDPTGTGKEFVLRDDTDSIKCVFYEIDRELPRLTRGQVHRVVGKADKKRGVLQVVTVRPAQKEERQVCQAAGTLSQAEMEQLAAQNNEQ